ncbi:uncharacterized protein LOC129568537 isoform X2 [Sitodiplosis mosellana]|uniref:uncharacterized protein LOC129568537 isoform X2 n=1 Tax=Sitodiplosis mosellana TaxID=263140 RepID=UPI00244388BC|nr:uncharacterized protein LOC129568537 isoform X2 [Sitodiplosis mosellana]
MSLILHQEMRKWRNKLTDVCRQFLELSPPERLDNGHFKEYFIRMTSDRLRRTTERYDSEKFTRKERCRPNKHSDGASQMIAHLDRIEHATRIFLNSANTQLDNDFMRYFCRQSEESISEAYDIFSSALKYGAYGTNGTSKDEQHTNKLTKRIANKRKASTSSVEEENMKEKRKKTHASSQSSRESHNSKLFSIMKNFFEIWQSGLKSSMHSKGSTKNDRKNKENVSKRSIEQKHNKINETGAGTSKQSLHRTSGNKRPKGLGHDQKKTSRDVIDKERSKDVRCSTETRHTKANRTGTGSSEKSLNRASGDERPKGSGREKSKDSRKDAKTGPLQLNNNPSNPKSLQYDQKKTSRDAIVKERSKDVRCTSNTRHTEANRTEKSKDSRNGANTEHFHRNKSPSKQSDPKKTSQNGIKQKAGEKQFHSLKHSEPTKSDKIRAKPSVQKTVLAQTRTTNCAVKLQAGSLVYHCFYCKDANEPTLFHSENDLYSHWLSAHNSSRTQPFQFYAVETVICYRCGEVGTFEELTNHYSQRHRDEVFVILRKGAEKCALCDYGGKWMNIHFKAEHRIQSKPKRLQSALVFYI